MKKKYILRNDLALQNKNYTKTNVLKCTNFKVHYYSDKKFSFTDICFQNLETIQYQKKLNCLLKTELKNYLKKCNLNKTSSCLVVGLGNKKVISDAIGVLTCENIIATGYFTNLNIKENYRSVYTYVPGTVKDSGYMAFKGIKALVKELKPDFLILVDSLICSHIKYLNSVIQLSDKGITPGSGLANYQDTINEETVGVPTIVIGVPTATYASTIIKDVLKIQENEFDFQDGYDFVVSSKDVDIIIERLAKIIAGAINETLNKFNTY